MMEKTIKINLGGILFQIEEDAYKILKKYLVEIDARLRHTQGGAETLEDIESRISEIFNSKGGQAGVISKENVEEVISIIGSPETFETGGDFRDPGASAAYQPSKKKMFRNPDDRIIGGVCSGLGAFLGMEPVWVRLLFIIFACFFGVGFFVYIALWIALPEARTDLQKKEMYGDGPRPGRQGEGGTSGISQSAGGNYPVGAGTMSNVGNAFNEVFRAIGKVLFVVVRVFLILMGIVFVLGGFFALVTVFMVFFFKYPDYFSTHSFGINLFYFPDFLNYIVNPAAAPWIIALSFIIITLPLLALIYWGVKMIFWFRARDGIVAIGALVLWVGSLAALTMIAFNEGISYSETAKVFSSDVIPHTPPDLYVVSGQKVSDLKYDKEISLPEDEYDIYFTNDNRNLYIGTRLNVYPSDDKSAKIDVVKRSMGRSRIDASKKAELLTYNYRVSGDTIRIDEYFTVPSGSKWSADNVKVNISIPEGTRVHFDKSAENMFLEHHHSSEGWTGDGETVTEYGKSFQGSHYWVMTEGGLEVQKTAEKNN
jgi:phage shock protein PspC (stress-responsive transcriptional regulator)